MPRPRTRSALLLVFVASGIVSSAYGCGIDEEGSAQGTSSGDPGTIGADATTGADGTNGSDATTGTDGTTDGTTKDAAQDGDAGSDGDAGVDAPVDASDEDAGPPPGPLSPTYVDYDINHVLWTGQSNSVANGANPPLTSAQPFTNVMFDTGVMPMTACDGNGCTVYQTPNQLVPLVEGDRFFTYAVETLSAGAANEIAFLAAQKFEFGARPGYPTKHDVLVTGHGRSGNTYWCLRKGGCPYNQDPPRNKNSPFAQGTVLANGPQVGHGEVTDALALATAAGKTYAVRAVVAVHGESDHYAYINNGGNHPEFPLTGTDGTPNKIKDYTDALVEWQEDYQAGIQAITGQAHPVPLFISGISGWTTTRESPIPTMQLAAHVRAHGKVVLVTPGYIFDVRNDCLHYSNHGQRRLGEYFAKVYARVVFGGETWEPVRPKTITRAGNVIDVRFYVPNPPLVFDTTRVVATPNMGFDFWDNGALATIANVALVGPDTVRITLAANPSGVNMRLKYAQNQPPTGTGCIGPGIQYARGAAGNLRDSDNTPSYYSDANGQPYPLHNWGVQFDEAVP
jgi:hypothetical protein